MENLKSMEENKKIAVKAIISLAGQNIEYVRLEVNQCYFDHSTFRLTVDDTELEEKFFQGPEKILSLISEKMIADIQHGDDRASAHTFVGIVTDVQMEARDGVHGLVHFSGSSPDILLERGKMTEVYFNTNLSSIIDTITSGTLGLSISNNPLYKGDIDFILQSEESDWTFLQRLSKMFMEELFWSGVELCIGSHQPWETVPLVYDVDLKKLELCSRLVSNQFSQYHYDLKEHLTFGSDAPDNPEGADIFVDRITGRSNLLNLTRKPNTPIHAPVGHPGDLMELNNRQKTSNAGQMVYVRGESKTSYVWIGRLLDISLPKTMGVPRDVGLFRVISTRHVLDQNRRYYNEFEAVPANLKHIPYRDIEVPKPYPIRAEIFDNEDPDQLGRCRVKFDFDQKLCQTWIPVATPDAGGNGQGLGYASRGFSFLPEKGDSVLVSFMDGPWLSQPVITGSLFHGANALGLGGGIGNHLKTITDKSKGQIRMNSDEAGEWGITIHDRNGNVIRLDTRGKNIEITTPESLILNSKNMFINVEENMVTKVGRNQETAVGKDRSAAVGKNNFLSVEANHVLEVTGNMEEFVEGNLQSVVEKDRTDVGVEGISISSENNITHHAGKTVDINSGERTKNL